MEIDLENPAYNGSVDETPLQPAKKSPPRPAHWPKGEWFHMSRAFRRTHYRCCWTGFFLDEV